MIRKIELRDYESVRKLVCQVHDLHYNNRPDIYLDVDPLPKDDFIEMLNNNDALNYLYEENDKVVGIIMATKQDGGVIPILRKREIYYIEDIVVNECHRRKGIEKKLYNYLFEKAKDNNIDSIELNVWAFNKSAIEFYKSLGMKEKNIRLEQKVNKGEAEYV